MKFGQNARRNARKFEGDAWSIQESRDAARKPRDAAAVIFGLKFAIDIHCMFKSSQASNRKLGFRALNNTGAKPKNRL